MFTSVEENQKMCLTFPRIVGGYCWHLHGQHYFLNGMIGCLLRILNYTYTCSLSKKKGLTLRFIHCPNVVKTHRTPGIDYRVVWSSHVEQIRVSDWPVGWGFSYYVVVVAGKDHVAFQFWNLPYLRLKCLDLRQKVEVFVDSPNTIMLYVL